ncbi:hypothetical protein AMECASPLE_027786 [Ameca splendens]|uniref:Transmembrane protein n=1 Tax=Ameca splendens TaxID=208324 RepID=A0ABV1A0T2_9TELE
MKSSFCLPSVPPVFGAAKQNPGYLGFMEKKSLDFNQMLVVTFSFFPKAMYCTIFFPQIVVLRFFFIGKTNRQNNIIKTMNKSGKKTAQSYESNCCAMVSLDLEILDF